MIASGHSEQIHNIVGEVARRSYGRLVAFLAVRARDVAAAEDALSEAFASALIDWPKHGCPQNPEAWLLTVARRKLIDAARRNQWNVLGTDELEILADEHEALSDAEIPDRRLALMFACAHPAIEAGVRAPLILQVILGLDAKKIASAFLTSPAAMAKRLVRAKEKIREAGIPFRIPEREELPVRLEAVLDAIYATFAEGWSDFVRADLTEESIFLVRIVCELLSEEPEALGLLALILHAEARRRARRNRRGEYVPLAEQNPDEWNWRMIEEAELLLRRAGTFGRPGRYQLEAALQSAHVYRRRTGEANWGEVVEIYDALLGLTQSPVVALNRALAVAEIHGAGAGLDAMPELVEYQPYWAARAELLARSGAKGEAQYAYEMAIGLEKDDAVRRFLTQRVSVLNYSG